MTFSSPQLVQERLEALDEALGYFQNDVEAAAMDWFRAKREREKNRAISFLAAKGSIAARGAVADIETATDGVDAEAAWEGKRSLLKALETRANVAMAILKSQSNH